MPNLTVPQRHFLAHLWDQTDECLVWPYGASAGYGLVQFNGGMERVHVRACTAWHGPRPFRGAEAAHGPCHNPLCWNGAHLRWATHRENLSADRDRDGTMLRGEQVKNSKVTAADVVAMRAAYAGGLVTQVQLMAHFGLSSGQVSRIITRQRWAHV